MQADSHDLNHLRHLAEARSKHCSYQLLHPLLSPVVGPNYNPQGKLECERCDLMERELPFRDRIVLDIGANTGYFSIHAAHSGARHVTAIEGNAEHAEFLETASRYLGLSDRLSVVHDYFDFEQSPADRADITLCLNVLHHVGDDFGTVATTATDAKQLMMRHLNGLAASTRFAWLQLGFNWMGDRDKPLFSEGTKSEVIDFVTAGVAGVWTVVGIWTYAPEACGYVEASGEALRRRDDIGEFSNRPMFLLQSET